jgi:hypothetical protein
MAGSSNTTPDKATQLIDPVDQVLRELLQVMALLAEDPNLHTRVLAALCADLLQRHGGEDAHGAWRQLEAAVVAAYSEALRLDRRDGPLHPPPSPTAGVSRRRPAAAKASSRPTRFGDGRV